MVSLFFFLNLHETCMTHVLLMNSVKSIWRMLVLTSFVWRPYPHIDTHIHTIERHF